MQGSEGRSLASMFATRNAASIAEALRQTVQNQAAIVDSELDELAKLEALPSETTGDPDDDAKNVELRRLRIEAKRETVMRNHNSVFANGVKLYKLDTAPAGVNLQINVGNGTVRAEAIRNNPRALAAEAQRQLEQEHETITPDMLYERVGQLQAALATADDDDTIEGEVL